VKYHVGNKEPPRISSGVFGWISPLIHTKEPELIDKIGLDAATFLRFLRMMRWLFTIIALLGCAMTMPVDFIYTVNHTKGSNKDVNLLTKLTIRDVHDTSLFAHVAASYAFTILVLFFAWRHWTAMVRIRNDWYRSPEYAESFYARTLLVTHVSKKYQSDEGVAKIFSDLGVPYPATSVHVGRRVGHLPELIEQHNNLVRELENYLVRYLKGGKIGKKRPTIRVGSVFGFGGKKVDAIDHYTLVLPFLVSEYLSNFSAVRNCAKQKPRSKRIGIKSTSGKRKITDSRPWQPSLMHISLLSSLNRNDRRAQLSRSRQTQRTSLVFLHMCSANLLYFTTDLEQFDHVQR
jgi:calcium permeable stress-gated cation channel